MKGPIIFLAGLGACYALYGGVQLYHSNQQASRTEKIARIDNVAKALADNEAMIGTDRNEQLLRMLAEHKANLEKEQK